MKLQSLYIFWSCDCSCFYYLLITKHVDCIPRLWRAADLIRVPTYKWYQRQVDTRSVVLRIFVKNFEDYKSSKVIFIQVIKSNDVFDHSDRIDLCSFEFWTVWYQIRVLIHIIEDYTWNSWQFRVFWKFEDLLAKISCTELTKFSIPKLLSSAYRFC